MIETLTRALIGLALAPLLAAPLGATDPDTATTRHLVIISVDGLRPDAIEAYELPTLRRLIAEGSRAAEARTVLPSTTLPSHTSMLTGQTPDQHGTTFNLMPPDGGIVAVPTIFELARERGYHTAAFFSKAKFRHLDRSGAYDYRQVPDLPADPWMASRTVPAAIRYLRERRPNLLFVHIGDPDYAGHGAGWMTPYYGVAARQADDAIAELVAAADEVYGAGQYTVLVTADHGGHGLSHGSDDPRDTAIPWIAWGRGVAQGSRPEGVRTTDTAATALWLLGVPVPAAMDGRPVYEAIRGHPVLAEPDAR